MRAMGCTSIVILCSCAAWPPVRVPSPPAERPPAELRHVQIEGFHDAAQREVALRELVATHPDACALSTIGDSREGRPIWMLELRRGGADVRRPAMAIVAGIDGDYPASSEVALRVAKSILDSKDAAAATLLDEHVVYVIPAANPDAIEWHYAQPRQEVRAALRPWDDDRDGLIDEDGPEDLNGDGLVTMMRKADPEATHLPDPAEPRLLKEADRAKGEGPVYKLYVEGTDNDGDEQYNEDAAGGVDINRNFMHGYAEHTAGTGPHQISEQESKALIDFFLQHPEISIVLVYGRHDNLVKTPGGEKRDVTGRAPLELHKDDVAIYKEVGDKYKEITGVKALPEEPAEGAFFAWSYAQYGVPTFACRVWHRPDGKKEEDKKEAPPAPSPDARPDGAPPTPDSTATVGERPAEPTTEPPGGEAPPVAGPAGTPPAEVREQPAPEGHPTSPVAAQPPAEGAAPAAPHAEPPASTATPEEKKDEKKKEPADKEGAAWLKYSDEQRAGTGFVPWSPFEHPQLGEVEIGGFVPFFRTTPPAEELDAAAAKQLAFVLDLAGRFVHLSLAEPKVRRLSTGVYEIETALVNDGYFPVAMAIARDNRNVRPTVVTVDLPWDRILGGERVQRVWSVAGSGGREKLRWVILGREGDTVAIKAVSDKYGERTLSVVLREGSNE